MKQLLMNPYLLVAIGGAFGSVLRFAISTAVKERWPENYFPWATFGINVVGSFLIGLSVALFLEADEPTRKRLHLLCGVGICGGFTTFSSYEYETFKLLESDKLGAAAAYVAGSVVLGFLAVFAGLRLGEAVA